MILKHQRLCLWSGPVFLVIYGIGLIPLAGLLPPMSPSMAPEMVARFYQHDTNTIRFGLMLMLTACGFFIPWVVLISDQIERIPGSSRILGRTQFGAGIANTVMLLIPPCLFTVTAFRPDRDPQLTVLLNDLSWIVFIMPFSLALIQWIVIAVAILSDLRPDPSFPRWLGFFNIFVALGFVPGGVITFFKSGPFAWSGLFGFWIPFAVFGAWFAVMFFHVWRSISDDATQPQDCIHAAH